MKKEGHLKFRKKLASQLMAHSSSFKYTTDSESVQTSRTISLRAGMAAMGHMILYPKARRNVRLVWLKVGPAQSGEKRKVLEELSENSVRINQNGEKSRRPRPPRTRYGCSACQIHLCQGGTCWEKHIQLSKLEN